ncbi:AraC family transcriptional regulator [Flavobacterium sp.]|uniref:helix-turn-helix domain-containing protein n=1 Tax=Flavobacterium sp. TaxID=239 RepID=UPI00260F32F3|nr:AraC family transcriptional regulator [Flavobacterium sp.]
MHYQFNFYSAILLIFFSQGIIFSYLLFRRSASQNRYADKLLGIFIVLCALYILPWMLGFAGWYFVQPYRDIMFYLPLQQLFLLGPLMYFYTCSQLDVSFKIVRKNFIHFIPAAMYLAYAFIVWVLDKIILGRYYFYADGHDKDLDSWYQLLGLFSMSIYGFMSMKKYLGYRRTIFNSVSFADTITFAWVKKYLFAFLAMQAIRIIFFVLYPEWGNFSAKGWYYLSFSILFYYIAIHALLNNVKSIAPVKLTEEGEPLPLRKGQEENQPADNLQFESWKLRISSFIEQHRSYENPELTLADLARDLQTNPTTLSKVINKAYGMNFNDFINNLRIEAFKQQLNLKVYEKHTLLAIAFDCGFNSKTTFNRAFKKNTSLTPKSYVAETVEQNNI